MRHSKQRVEMTALESNIRDAAIRASYGETADCLEPSVLSEAAEYYLEARDLFEMRRSCAAWDAIEAGDRLVNPDALPT